MYDSRVRPSLRPGTRVFALVALSLWLVGFDLLPMAHLVFHDAVGDHQHGPRHSHAHDAHAHRVVDHDGHDHHPHSHQAGMRRPHSDAHESQSADRSPSSPSQDSEHGEGSVAHRDLAAQVAPVLVPTVPETRFAYEALCASSFDDDPSRVSETATRARAPPRT